MYMLQVYVLPFSWGSRETHKQNSQEISGNVCPGLNSAGCARARGDGGAMSDHPPRSTTDRLLAASVGSATWHSLGETLELTKP